MHNILNNIFYHFACYKYVDDWNAIDDDSLKLFLQDQKRLSQVLKQFFQSYIFGYHFLYIYKKKKFKCIFHGFSSCYLLSNIFSILFKNISKMFINNNFFFLCVNENVFFFYLPIVILCLIYLELYKHKFQENFTYVFNLYVQKE